MTQDARPTLQAPDDDPYLWLEEIDGARALAWVDAKSAETLRRFGSERFARDRDTLAALWDRPDKIPMVTRRGDAALQFLAGREKSAWSLAEHHMASYRTPATRNGRSCSMSTRSLEAKARIGYGRGSSMLPPTHAARS